jgi:hypothetical protein
VRLGLDEAPEYLVCKCKSPTYIIGGVIKKIGSVAMFGLNNTRIVTNKIMNVEVDVSLIPQMSRLMYERVRSDFFGHPKERELKEIGCSW